MHAFACVQPRDGGGSAAPCAIGSCDLPHELLLLFSNQMVPAEHRPVRIGAATRCCGVRDGGRSCHGPVPAWLAIPAAEMAVGTHVRGILLLCAQAATLDVQDLEEDVSPEELMLSYVSGEKSKVSRAERPALSEDTCLSAYACRHAVHRILRLAAPSFPRTAGRRPNYDWFRSPMQHRHAAMHAPHGVVDPPPGSRPTPDHSTPARARSRGPLCRSRTRTQDRTDREVVTPWFRFLWESYRSMLEILRTNPKLEHLYAGVASKAFNFCLQVRREGGGMRAGWGGGCSWWRSAARRVSGRAAAAGPVPCRSCRSRRLGAWLVSPSVVSQSDSQ